MPVALHGLPAGGPSAAAAASARAAFLSEVPAARAAFLPDVQADGIMPDARRGSAPPRGHGDFLFGGGAHTGFADTAGEDAHSGPSAIADHKAEAHADEGAPNQVEVNGIADAEVDDMPDDDLDGAEADADHNEAAGGPHDGVPASLPPGMQELMKALAAARDAEAAVGRMAASRPPGLAAAAAGSGEGFPGTAGAARGVPGDHAGGSPEGADVLGGDEAGPKDAELHAAHGDAASGDHAAAPEGLNGAMIYSAKPDGGSMVGAPFSDLPPETQQELMRAIAAARAAGASAGGHAAPEGADAGRLGDAGALRLQEAGFHIDLSGLKVLRTAVLVTGGLCSKLFGIGLMGYLAFQSMQANITRPQQQQQQRQDSAQGSQSCYSRPQG